MRITNSMMISNVLRDLNSGLGRTNKYYSQLASNRKMVKLSDNPVGLVNSLNARQEMRQLSQYRENIVTTRKWTQQAETAITDMQSIIVSIKENVVDAGGTKNPDDRKNIASLVRELKAHLYESANTSIGDKFIFGGFNSTKKPFTEENGKILYNGIDLTDTAPKSTTVGTDGKLNPLTFTNTATNIDNTTFELVGVTNPPDQYTIERTGDNKIKVTGSGGKTYDIDITDAMVKTKPIMDDKTGKPTGKYKNELEIRLNDLKVGTMTWESTPQKQEPTKGNLTSIQWGGNIKADGNYTIEGTGATVEIKNSDGVAVATKTFTDTDTAWDLSGYGLGVISWENNEATKADAEGIADAIRSYVSIDADVAKGEGMAKQSLDVFLGAMPATGSGTSNPKITVSSNLYQDKTKPVFKTDLTTAGLATWDGPITAPNKYYLSVVKDRDGDATNRIAIHDAQGTFIGEKEIGDGDTKLDLKEFGLGEITFGAGDGKAKAAAVANVGYVTTAVGEENAQKIQFEIGFKIKMDATFTGIDIMGEGEQNLFKVIDDLLADLEDPNKDNDDLTVYHTRLSKVQDRLLTAAVELGARTQKLETMENRYSLDNINMEARRTDIEDIDQAETIMKMKFAEAIYKQALATGAMIIQPTLMDFLNG